MPKDNRTNILPPRPPPFETRMQNKVRKNANVRCLMDEIGICLIRTHCKPSTDYLRFIISICSEVNRQTFDISMKRLQFKQNIHIDDHTPTRPLKTVAT